MPVIARNGLSGLGLRIATMALAASLFGCTPKPAAGAPEVLAQPDLSKS
jgi:hypothetical protein